MCFEQTILLDNLPQPIRPHLNLRNATDESMLENVSDDVKSISDNVKTISDDVKELKEGVKGLATDVLHASLWGHIIVRLSSCWPFIQLLI
jgi:hypothetical protein